MIHKVKVLLLNSSISYTYEYNFSGNPHAFYFDQMFEHGFMRGVIGFHTDDEMVHIYRFFPTALPKEQQAALLEYIARINNNIIHGTFQLDLEDMTLGIDAIFSISNDEAYNERQLQEHFHSITGSLNKYFKGALEVGFGGKDPAQVLNKLELNIDPRLN